MGTCGRTSEVEEQTDGRSISTFLQGHALTLQYERYVGLHVVTLLDEEVGIARVGKLEGYTRAVLICLHHEVEVVSLRGTGRQFGVDVELTLPLAATKTLRKCDLISIATVGSFAIGDRRPTVVSKVVAESIEHRTVINSLPEIYTTLVVPVHRRCIFLATTGIILRQFRAIVISMILQNNVPDIDHRRTCSTTEVKHEFHL